jgi:hypothetical protein
MEKVQDRESSTKISISKNLHEVVKIICIENGLKMQYFEDKAIKEYIQTNYPNYIEKL